MASSIRKKYPQTPGVLWHVDVIPSLEKLTAGQRDRVFMDSLVYRRDGIEPDYSDDLALDMFWSQYRNRMDYDEAGYYDASTNGKYGGSYGQYKARERREGKEPLTFQAYMEVFYPNVEL